MFVGHRDTRLLPFLASLKLQATRKFSRSLSKHQHVMLVGGPVDDISIYKFLGSTLGLLFFGEVVQRKIKPRGIEYMLYLGEEIKDGLM